MRGIEYFVVRYGLFLLVGGMSAPLLVMLMRYCEEREQRAAGTYCHRRGDGGDLPVYPFIAYEEDCRAHGVRGSEIGRCSEVRPLGFTLAYGISTPDWSLVYATA